MRTFLPPQIPPGELSPSAAYQLTECLRFLCQQSRIDVCPPLELLEGFGVQLRVNTQAAGDLILGGGNTYTGAAVTYTGGGITYDGVIVTYTGGGSTTFGTSYTLTVSPTFTLTLTGGGNYTVSVNTLNLAVTRLNLSTADVHLTVDQTWTLDAGVDWVIGGGSSLTINTLLKVCGYQAWCYYTAATITWGASQNDFPLPGPGTVFPVVPTANVDLTGIVPPTVNGSAVPALAVFVNTSADKVITLRHQSASSTATNRLILQGAVPLVIPPGGLFVWFYNTAAARGQVLGGYPTTTKGDLLVFDGTQPVRKPVGADGLPLVGKAADPTGLAFAVLGNAGGGTGIDTSAVTDGQLLIGKTSDHSWNAATITAGANITVTNSGGGITIAAAAGAPDVAKLFSSTFSGVSTVDITSAITSTYKFFKLVGYDLRSSAGTGLHLRTSTDNGGTWDSGASDYNSTGAAADKVTLYTMPSDASTSNQSAFELTLLNPSGTALAKGMFWDSFNGPAAGVRTNGYGSRDATADVDALRLLVTTGTFSGTVELYGYK